VRHFSQAVKLTAWSALVLFGCVLVASPAWAWFAESHEIIAVIAADDLTPSARAHLAQILGVPADTGSIEKAMAAASIRPDTEFREEDRSTAPWHFIDICLQDSETDLPARCPHGNCVTAKIDEYARRLRNSDYDKWGAAGDLAFLIHLVGDIHQPLHTTMNADRGGTCQRVNVEPPEENLHITPGTMRLSRC
jgi:nuclease S1